MSKSRGYCVFLLITLLAGSSSGTGISSMSVCLNDSVQVFKGITSASGNSDLSLYLNGLNNKLVAMWSMKNSTLSATILPSYKEKVFREKDGSIWIRNVNLSDESKYVIHYDIDSFSTKSSTTSEVQVEVMVAPNKDCKPRIRRLNTSLNATLDDNVCGKPIVSVYWLDFHGNSFRDKTISLSPGSEDGSYYACIEGPAQKCVNNFKQMDYCSKYPIGGVLGVVNRSVCLGDSVQLIDSGDTDVSLYKYGANVTFLAKWSTKNSVVTSSIPSKYKQKVHLDENGTLWIQNINLSDEGKYIIQYETNGSSSNAEVQINVMVAPTQRCKPKIHRVDNILQASLEAEHCGTPTASVNWLDRHRNLYKNERVKLLPRSEAGTYYACIEGPALNCVNTLTKLDYCSTYTIRDIPSPQSATVNTPVIVTLAIVVVILIGVVLLLYWRKSLIDKCSKGAQAPNPTQREAKGCLVNFKTWIHERFRFRCDVKGCEKKCFTKSSLRLHKIEHILKYISLSIAANTDLTGVFSNINLDIINPHTLPSQSQAKSSQATSSLEEDTPLLLTDRTKTETHIEVNADHPAKNTTRGHSRKKVRFPCPIEKCNQKYSSKKSLCQHISEHHPSFMTTANAANPDINTDLSNVNIDTSSRYTLPSQSKVNSIQAASTSDEDTPMLATDGSKIETVVEVHDSPEKYRAERSSRKRETFHCPIEQCQQKYSKRERLCQHISEHHPGFVTASNAANPDICTHLSNVNKDTRDTLRSQTKVNYIQSTSVSATSKLYVHMEKQKKTYHYVKDECENENNSKASLGQSSTMNLLASVSNDLATNHDVVKRLSQEDLDASPHFTISSLPSDIPVNFSNEEQMLSMRDDIEINGIPVSEVLE